MGADQDIEIVLTIDGNATVLCFGNAVTRFAGPFGIATGSNEEPDKLLLPAPDFPDKMQSFAIYSDRNEFLLVPAEGAEGFACRKRFRDLNDEYDGKGFMFRQIKNQDP